MANQVTNYKCPACTGPLRFDSATGKLQCDFCGSSYEVAEIEKLYAEKDAQAAGAFRQAEEQAAADGEWTSASGSDWGADAEKLRVYSCPSCGAELICDETTSATSCPYCGNNTIVPGQFSGALKPDYVLPFKLDKAAAVAALKKHYGGKKLLPKAFSNENHIEEVKGVYVPFWLYDGSAEVDVRCHGTKVSGYSTARENVTVTNHYDVRRAGAVRFERVPVDASSKMPDDHMDAIEPFDYKELKPFSTAYLPGFLADKYDVSVQDCAERADSRCETSAVELMEQDARGDYTSCTVESRNVTLHRGKVHYALMPVWLLSTKWNGKSFLFGHERPDRQARRRPAARQGTVLEAFRRHHRSLYAGRDGCRTAPEPVRRWHDDEEICFPALRPLPCAVAERVRRGRQQRRVRLRRRGPAHPGGV